MILSYLQSCTVSRYGQLFVKFSLSIGVLHFNALAEGDPLRISRWFTSPETRMIFYLAAWNADAVLRWEFCLSVRLSVCPSVCLSVCQTRALWQNGKKSVQIFIPCERSFGLIFWEEEWLVGRDPLYLKFWVNPPPFERNRRFWTNNRS